MKVNQGCRMLVKEEKISKYTFCAYYRLVELINLKNYNFCIKR